MKDSEDALLLLLFIAVAFLLRVEGVDYAGSARTVPPVYDGALRKGEVVL